MDKCSVAQINTLSLAAKNADFVQPSEQIFVLSSSQLQNLIREATAPLIAKIDALEVSVGYQDQVRAEMARRIKKLENKPESKGPIFLERLDKLEGYISAREDHKASFEQLKGFLQVKDNLLNLTIRALMQKYPGAYAITKDKNDKRRKWFTQINPLPK